MKANKKKPSKHGGKSRAKDVIIICIEILGIMANFS